MRLIDADALKSYIDCGHLRPPTVVCFSELDVVRMLDRQPTIDAEPVRHGRWIPNIKADYKAYPPYEYQSGYKCTLCGRVERTNKEPYCHCGAKMQNERGEENESN